MKRLLVAEHTAPYVFFHMAIDGGYLCDPIGGEGTAYLSGNGLLSGTETRSREVLFDELDALGACIDVSVFRDFMMLEGEVLSRNIEPFVALLGEVCFRPAYPEDEIARLKRRTVARLAQIRDDDEALCGYAHARFLWEGHVFARPSTGTAKSIESIDTSDLTAFHRERFQKKPLCLSAAGDLDEGTLNDLADRYLVSEELPEPSAGPDIPAFIDPPGIRVLLVDKPDRTQAQVLWGHSCVPASSPAIYPLQVANTAFGGTFTGRLMHEIREKRGWSYGAYSGMTQDRRVGTFSMRYNVDAVHLVDALELSHDLMRAWVEDGITSDELKFVKSYLSNAYAFQLETAGRRLARLLDVELLGRPTGHLTQYVERILAVSQEDLLASLRQHIHPDDVAVTIVCSAEDVANRIERWEGLKELRVLPYDQVGR